MFYSFNDVTKEEIDKVNKILSKDMVKPTKDQGKEKSLDITPLTLKPELPTDDISVNLK